MNLYENLATQAITSFFYQEPVWKKEVLYDFLLSPFKLSTFDIVEVKTQDHFKESIPDFTIITKDGKRIRYEVKINNSGLIFSEQKENTRDAYLIRKNYYFRNEIPIAPDKILFWEDLFELIDQKGATKDFERFCMIPEYMHEDIHTLLLTPHEVAMLYSKDTIIAVYGMKEKVKKLCENFLDNNEFRYRKGNPQDDENGIGYYFDEKDGEKREFFIGLSPHEDKFFSVAKRIEGANDSWDFFELDKEILAKCTTDDKLQEEFNKNVEDVIGKI